MRLLPCNPPVGTLEPAPRTSLRKDTRDERWEGFWSLADEKYYARCTSAHGVEQWYRVVDEARTGVSAEIESRKARVLPLRRRESRTSRSDVSRMLLLWAPSGRRPILVGTRPPRASAKPRNLVQRADARGRDETGGSR